MENFLIYLAKCFLMPNFLKVCWGSWIWDLRILVRSSLTIWCVLHVQLPMMDLLHDQRFIGPNCCILCRVNEESFDHLFVNCPLVRAAREWLFNLFGVSFHGFLSCHELFLCCVLMKWFADFRALKVCDFDVLLGYLISCFGERKSFCHHQISFCGI